VTKFSGRTAKQPQNSQYYAETAYLPFRYRAAHRCTASRQNNVCDPKWF